MGPPLTDSTILVVAKLFDDAGATREPSHSEIEFQIQRCGCASGDPAKSGPPVGKAKRIRGTLNWALAADASIGEALMLALLTLLRTSGGFRITSPNYVGEEPIANAISVFRSHGFVLSSDGDLSPAVLEGMAGREMSNALIEYARRARRGVQDAAMLVGTGKDLVEATAAHVIVESFGSYSQSSNFPTLLGQAFVGLEFATPHDPSVAGERPQRKVERALYELACAVNSLRNKEGVGHGRPWLPSVTNSEARAAVEAMGVVAGAMLDKLAEQKAAR